jgi:hypothetical protein
MFLKLNRDIWTPAQIEMVQILAITQKTHLV